MTQELFSQSTKNKNQTIAPSLLCRTCWLLNLTTQPSDQVRPLRQPADPSTTPELAREAFFVFALVASGRGEPGSPATDTTGLIREATCLAEAEGSGEAETSPPGHTDPRQKAWGHLQGEIGPDCLSVLTALPLVFFASKIGQPPATA